MNIIVIVSDTLRRDHLGCYGNPDIRTPNLDAFARQGVVFDGCHAASFPTVPARADLMTGRNTFLFFPWGPLPQSETTLPDLLRKAGYATAAVADTPFLTRNGYGQDRGFQDFIYVRGQLDGTERDYRKMQRPFSEQEGYCAPKTFTEAAAWLQRHREKKFFLYVDTWDPHEPWDPPAYYVKPYLPDYQGQQVHPVYWDYKEDGLTEADVAIAHACYQGEISMVDHWFGFLMERLRVFNLLDDTAILFLSDHGFYFGEHGWFGKRRFRWPDGSSFDAGFSKGLKMGQQTVYRSPLHNEITRVPLVMHLPGTAARRVPGVVSLPDVMPTVLEIAGVQVPERVQGTSLLSMARGEASGVHDLVVTCAPFEEIGQISKTVDDRTRVVQEISPCSITDGEWDLLYAVNGQPVELFNRQSDPGHHHNLFDSQRQVAERLHAGFVGWLEANGAPQDQIEMRRHLG